jgi:hypothetical protein
MNDNHKLILIYLFLKYFHLNDKYEFMFFSQFIPMILKDQILSIFLS